MKSYFEDTPRVQRDYTGVPEVQRDAVTIVDNYLVPVDSIKKGSPLHEALSNLENNSANEVYLSLRNKLLSMEEIPPGSIGDYLVRDLLSVWHVTSSGVELISRDTSGDSVRARIHVTDPKIGFTCSFLSRLAKRGTKRVDVYVGSGSHAELIMSNVDLMNLPILRGQGKCVLEQDISTPKTSPRIWVLCVVLVVILLITLMTRSGRINYRPIKNAAPDE